MCWWHRCAANAPQVDAWVFRGPAGFAGPQCVALETRFANVSGGYKLASVDGCGFGVYENLEVPLGAEGSGASSGVGSLWALVSTSS